MSIAAYTNGTDVTAVIPLIADDVDIDAQSVQYRIIDNNDVELVPKTAIADFIVGSSDVTVFVSALINTIGSLTDTREMRVIELYINDGVGEVKIDYWYIVELSNVLIEGLNSFQGYGKALMTAMSIQKIPGWDAANKESRSNALIEARRNIGSVPLRHYFYDVNITHTDSNFIFRDITRLTQQQFVALPVDLKDGLCRAQILQANYLLTIDENDELREAGVLSVAVGDAKQSMKAALKYKGLVHKRAMVELSRWLIHGIRTAR
jgi:hypothetical protein